jgi:thiol-disulfide isomerase/thioredoxin
MFFMTTFMATSRFLAATLVCCLATTFAHTTFQVHAQSVLSGRILGFNGKPVARADVFVAGATGNSFRTTTKASKDGSFRLALPQGLYYATFRSPMHKIATSPLVVGEQDKTVTVTATLEPKIEATNLEDVRVMGDFNKFDARSAQPTTKQANGTFTLEFTPASDTVAYQFLLKIKNSPRPVVMGGTAIDKLYLIAEANYGDGYHSSAIGMAGKPITLVFDSKLLPKPSKNLKPSEKLVFDKAHSYLSEMAVLDRRVGEENSHIQKAFEEFTAKGGDRNAFRYNVAPLQTSLQQAFMNMKNPPALRTFAAVKYMRPLQPYMTGGERSTETMRVVRELLPPELSAWALYAESAVEMFGYEESLMRDFIAKQENRTLKARMLVSILVRAMNMGNEAQAEQVYNELKANYGSMNDEYVQYALETIKPVKDIAKGKPIPAFEVRLMQRDSVLGDVVSNKSMLGRYYMMDFWAVWCAPCRGELPGLHKAYDKFKSKFSVLSLSFDRSMNDVSKYREKKETPMPWLHTFVERGFDSPLAKAFEVDGIPKPILVGPDGTIVAMQEELRGDQLEQTLARVLGTAKMQSDDTGAGKK